MTIMSDPCVVDTIVAERAGVLAYARTKCGQVDRMIAAKRLTADEGAAVKTALRSIADEIATGLHRDGDDPVGVRAAMRETVRG